MSRSVVLGIRYVGGDSCGRETFGLISSSQRGSRGLSTPELAEGQLKVQSRA